MNNFIGIGRLVRDPELRYLQSGIAVANFTLAIERQMSKEKKDEAKKNGEVTADFIRIVVWGKVAENCANYLAKGRLVAVQGKVQTGSYEKDGQRIYTTDINASNVEFLEWGEKENKSDSNFDSGIDGFHPSDDDIPF